MEMAEIMANFYLEYLENWEGKVWKYAARHGISEYICQEMLTVGEKCNKFIESEKPRSSY